ncbi:MAG: O-antigen ligase family protein [bacterium]
MYVERERWAREAWFWAFSLCLAYVFFYLTTHKRPPLTLTAAVGFVALGVVTHMALKKAKSTLYLIFLFLPFFPFLRIQIIRYEIVGYTVMFIAARWTEFLMLLSLLGRKLGGVRRILYSAPLLDFLILAYVLVGLVYLGKAVRGGNTFMGLWGLKDQFLFFTYYALVRFIPLGKEDLKRFLTISALIAAAIAAFGALQAQFLGDGFLRTLGYGIDIPGTGLTYVDPSYKRTFPGGISFIRAISILQDALSLGAYLMVFLLILQPFYFMPERKDWRLAKRFLYFILLLGLFYTTTRSAWIGTAAGTLYLGWRGKRLLVTSSVFLLLGAVFLLLLLSFPGGKQFLLGSFFQADEASLTGHLSKYGWQFQTMLDNPLGLGLGMTGRVGIQFGSVLQGGFNTECWYLQVGTQMGVLGFALYVGITLETLRKLFLLGLRLRDPFLRDLADGVFAAYLACALFAISLNVWQCHLIPIFIHLFVGMAIFHFPFLDGGQPAQENAVPARAA